MSNKYLEKVAEILDKEAGIRNPSSMLISAQAAKKKLSPNKAVDKWISAPTRTRAVKKYRKDVKDAVKGKASTREGLRASSPVKVKLSPKRSAS